MANTKISALTSATTPLAGTEVLPIVQSSATVKVATNDLTVRNIRANATTGILQVTGPAAASTRVMTVPDANFTAARTDAAQSFTGDQTLSTGNLVIGTSGKGIDFSATSGSGTSELLADYEEGTWTPTFYGGGTAGTYTPSVYKATYTKVGRLVVARADFTFSAASGGTGTVRVAGLPFSYNGQCAMPAVVSSAYVDTTTASGLGLFVNQASSGTSTELYMYQCLDATAQEQIPISGISTNSRIAFVISYEV